eukprot:5897733-Prymnesium_polylepis.1
MHPPTKQKARPASEGMALSCMTLSCDLFQVHECRSLFELGTAHQRFAVYRCGFISLPDARALQSGRMRPIAPHKRRAVAAGTAVGAT